MTQQRRLKALALESRFFEHSLTRSLNLPNLVFHLTRGGTRGSFLVLTLAAASPGRRALKLCMEGLDCALSKISIWGGIYWPRHERDSQTALGVCVGTVVTFYWEAMSEAAKKLLTK